MAKPSRKHRKKARARAASRAGAQAATTKLVRDSTQTAVPQTLGPGYFSPREAQRIQALLLPELQEVIRAGVTIGVSQHRLRVGETQAANRRLMETTGEFWAALNRMLLGGPDA